MLVVGLAVTGVPLVKVLCNLGADVIVNDLKGEDELKDSIDELSGLNVDYILGKHPQTIDSLGHIDLTVVSPGCLWKYRLYGNKKQRDRNYWRN